MTPQELDEIRTRCEAAYPAPWDQNSFTGELLTGDGIEFGQIRKDAERVFVVEARTDIPALLAEVERLRGLIRKTEQLEDGHLLGVYKCLYCARADGEPHKNYCDAFTPDGEVK